MIRNLPATTDNNRRADSYFAHTTKGCYKIEISGCGLTGTRHRRHRASMLGQQSTAQPRRTKLLSSLRLSPLAGRTTLSQKADTRTRPAAKRTSSLRLSPLAGRTTLSQ
jgi:hypothetical protein